MEGTGATAGSVVVKLACGEAGSRTLCQRVPGLIRRSGARLVICDVGSLLNPDVATVEGLVRLRLVVGRERADLHLRAASDELLELIDLMGLREELTVESGRQIEQGEQPLGVQEEVQSRDPPS